MHKTLCPIPWTEKKKTKEIHRTIRERERELMESCTEHMGFGITPSPILVLTFVCSGALGKSLHLPMSPSSAVTWELGGCHTSISGNECGELNMVPATQKVCHTHFRGKKKP